MHVLIPDIVRLLACRKTVLVEFARVQMELQWIPGRGRGRILASITRRFVHRVQMPAGVAVGQQFQVFRSVGLGLAVHFHLCNSCIQLHSAN